MTDIRAALEALVEELRPNCGKLRDQHGPLMGLGYAAALDDIADALAAASPEPERCAFSLGCGGKRDDPQHHRPYSGWGSLMAHDYEEPRTQPAPAAPTVEALRDALLADVRSLINSLLVAPSPEHVDEAVVALSVRLDAIIFAPARADERTRLGGCTHHCEEGHVTADEAVMVDMERIHWKERAEAAEARLLALHEDHP